MSNAIWNFKRPSRNWVEMRERKRVAAVSNFSWNDCALCWCVKEKYLCEERISFHQNNGEWQNWPKYIFLYPFVCVCVRARDMYECLSVLNNTVNIRFSFSDEHSHINREREECWKRFSEKVRTLWSFIHIVCSLTLLQVYVKRTSYIAQHIPTKNRKQFQFGVDITFKLAIHNAEVSFSSPRFLVRYFE